MTYVSLHESMHVLLTPSRPAQVTLHRLDMCMHAWTYYVCMYIYRYVVHTAPVNLHVYRRCMHGWMDGRMEGWREGGRDGGMEE